MAFYGILWYQLFEIIDNVTWTILQQKLLAILRAILNFETFIEEQATSELIY